jgi:hypothetical protein
MQLYRIGFVSGETQGELHLGFTVEENAHEWVATNNQLALEHKGLPTYTFLGVL